MGELTETLSTLIDRGGWIMVPLLALSVVAISLIMERSVFWMTLHRGRRKARLAALHRQLRTGDRAKASALVRGDRSPYGLLAARMLKDGASDAVASEAAEELRPRVDRFMVTLSTIITAAPLLGILGTVIGIIRSFNLLGTENTLTDPRVVSVGIAEALLTTALGLVVALMTLFPYMIFKGQLDRALGRMESIIAAAQEGDRAGSGADESSSARESSLDGAARAASGQDEPSAAAASAVS